MAYALVLIGSAMEGAKGSEAGGEAMARTRGVKPSSSEVALVLATYASAIVACATGDIHGAWQIALVALFIWAGLFALCCVSLRSRAAWAAPSALFALVYVGQLAIGLLACDGATCW